MGLKTVAGGFLIACVVTVAGALAMYRYQDWVFAFLRRLWGPQARGRRGEKSGGGPAPR